MSKQVKILIGIYAVALIFIAILWGGLDRSVESFVNEKRPESLNALVIALSETVLWFSILLPPLVFILIGGRFSGGESRIWAIPFAGGVFVAGYIGEAIKMIVGRERPFVAMPDIISRLVDETGFSFPSIHTTCAFCMFAIVNRVYPNLRVPFLVLTTLMALTRVYVGVHYLSDLFGGAMLGYTVGILLVKLTDRFISRPLSSK